MGHLSFLYMYTQKPLGECVYKEIQVTSGMFHGIP